MEVTRMIRLMEMLTLSMKSRNGVGRGMSMTNRMTITPTASMISPCLAKRL